MNISSELLPLIPPALLVVQGAAASNSALVTGGAVAIALGLVEVAKSLVAKLKGEEGSRRPFGDSERAILRELHRWHAPTAEGTQEWKNPNVRTLLEEIRDSLRVIESQGERRP